MFQPNSLRALRGMSASQKDNNGSKNLLQEVNNAIDEIRDWKQKEQHDLKKQLNQNQIQSRTLFKSGYEEEDDISQEVQRRELELNTRLVELRNQYRQQMLHIPSYMSSKLKTQEVTQKLQQSADRLANLPNLNFTKLFEVSESEEVIEKLCQWRNALVEADDLIAAQPYQEQIKEMENSLTQLQDQQRIEKDMKAEFEQIDRDFEEIEEMLKQCGIK